MENVELKFPVVAHQRIIVDMASRDDVKTKALLADFDLVSPVSEGNRSSGGKYVSYAVSVRFQNHGEMVRFDEQLKLVPGLKMVL